MTLQSWRPPPDAEIKQTDLSPGKFLVDHFSTLSLSGEDIENLRPPIVIENFIRRGGVLMLGAESKSRKSWLAQDAALSVAQGSDWLADANGNQGFRVAKASAHVFDLELNRAEVSYRFARTRTARFPDAEVAFRVTDAFKHYSLAGVSAASVLAVIETALPSISPGDIVVVDCFYRLCSDSNEAAAVGVLFALIKHWAESTQAAWIIVDHFRKAGADKARDRFNGSFIKSAAPDCLLAIECKKDGVFQLNIDARSFYGPPRVWCTWDDSRYTFIQRSSMDVASARTQAKRAKAYAELAAVWAHRDHTDTVATAEAAAAWRITSQGARNRMRQYEGETLVVIKDGKPARYSLTNEGRELLRANNACAGGFA